MPGSTQNSKGHMTSCQALPCGPFCSGAQEAARRAVMFIATQQEVDYLVGATLLYRFEHKVDYKDSEDWQRKREEAKVVLGYHCVACGSSDRLALHHKSYLSYTQERLEHLAWLCIKCHFPSHRWGQFSGKSIYEVVADDGPSEAHFVQLVNQAESLGYGRTGWLALFRVLLDYAAAHPDLFRQR